MKNQSVLKAEFKGLFNCVRSYFVRSVFADEVESDKSPTIKYEELIANARKEEKEKLYPQIEKLKKENNEYTIKLNEALIANATSQKRIKELEESKGSSADMEKELKEVKAKLEVLESENTNLKDKLEKAPKEEEIVNRVKSEYEIKDYIRESIASHSKEILKVFQSDVKGKTKEEVDASIKAAIDKSNEVRKEMGVDTSSKKQKDSEVITKVKRPQRVTPADKSNFENLDAEYIRNLDPKSEEYKKFRKDVLGLKK